ncbi:MAG: PKD domain-containing protein [Thermoleophilia bacterium]|nr:PKD domain-containing protein [Thermoleophilia bacterium]
MTRRLKHVLATLVSALVCLTFGAVGASADTDASSGTTQWRDWSFTWDRNSGNEGLTLTDVDYKGVRILGRASLPVMRVYYDNDTCGPYSDQLGGYVYPISWAGGARVAHRSYVKDGQEWLEVGISDRIGSYNLYQAWYFSADGMLDAHVFSSGLQCNVDHRHYPYWLMDFDIDGTGNDRIQRKVGDGWVTQSSEFDGNGTTDRYRVFDAASGVSVDVVPGPGDWPLPGESVVGDAPGSDRAVFGRLSTNVPPLTSNTIAQLVGTFLEGQERPHATGASINGADVSLIYRSRMPHFASEGSTLWHSSGPRFIVRMPAPNQPPAAAAAAVPTIGDAPLDVAFTAAGSTDPDGSTLTYAWNFGDGTTATGVSPSHRYTTPGTYTARVTVRDENGATDSASVRVDVSPAAPSLPISDDFSAATLDGRWQVTDPLGGSQVSTTGTGSLKLAVPGGTPHALWLPNQAVRVTEPTSDDDYDYEVKFTTTPTERFQEQGLITTEADGDWLAFDLWSDGGGRVHAWIGATVNGGGPTTLGAREDLAVTPGAPIWMRVSRDANVWTMEVSSDGATYTPVASVSHTLVPTRVGVHAGNDGPGAPAFTTYVDYVFDRAHPIDPEDGGTSANRAPTAAAAAAPSSGAAPLAVTFSSAGTSDPDGDDLSYRWDFGDGGSSTQADPVHTYAAAGTYTAQLTVMDPATASASASTTVTVAAPAPGTTGISDTFTGPVLDPRWELSDAVGNSSAGITATGQLRIGVPAGSGHPLWVPNQAASVTAAAPDIDGTVTVKFDSFPSGQYTEQGLIYREADGDFLAFDLWSDGGSGLNTWVGAQVNGTGPVTLGDVVHLNDTSGPMWLRVERSGDDWTMSVSRNGTSFARVTQVTHTMQVARIGPLAGNDGTTPPFAALVDQITDSNG